jgi:hypothetical protein
MRTWILMIILSIPLAAESVAGLHWVTPPGWKSEGARPMRAATYTLGQNTECAVYFFGQGQGGSVEANMARWSSQIVGPQGKPVAPQIRKRTIHGLAVTTIDSSGAYTGMAGPVATQQKAVPDYRLMGAVIEGPGGNVFIKFTGPSKTVTQNAGKFEQLLASFEPESFKKDKK